MKNVFIFMILMSLGVVIAGCHPKEIRKNSKHNKKNIENRLPSDRSVTVPNCAADGPGCRQFNPNR